MPPVAVTFGLVPELRQTSHRAIGFLRGESELNAWQEFTGLAEKTRKYVLTSMGEWIDGKNGPAQRFRGFPNHQDCWMCFVFKARENRQGHRFYGYLCHPLPNSNSSFQSCVFCIHAMKNEKETDKSELAGVKAWSSSKAAEEAIRVQYPDGDNNERKGRQGQWKN